LRRALLEATPAGRALFARIADLFVQRLERHADPKVLPSGSQLVWLAVEIVAVNLAGVIFEPMLARVLRRSFSNLVAPGSFDTGADEFGRSPLKIHE
jgi:hypothetical protein